MNQSIIVSFLVDFRRKREYAKKNLNQLLDKNGIRVELLMPRRQETGAKTTLTTPGGDGKGRHAAKVDPFPPILPLEVSIKACKCTCVTECG